MGECPTAIDDTAIYDIVRALNNRPYIQTILCCSGHLLWERRENDDPPYIEYYVSAPEGYALTTSIEAHINAQLPTHPPRVRPCIRYHKDGSLRFRGIYDGSWSETEHDIRAAVDHFWQAFRDVLHG